MELAELLDRTGLDVLDHLDRQVTVPVIDGLQAQGDLLVLPLSLIAEEQLWRGSRRPLPAGGEELVRGEGGNNPHTLVADPGTCHLTIAVSDSAGLGIAVFENTAPAYLVHPEHGGTGIAPGSWLVRRQREMGGGFRKPVLVAD